MDNLDYRIGKLSLAPGDVLVVKLGRHATDEQFARARAYLEPFLPAGGKALVIGPDVDLSVLSKADIDARSEG